MDTIEYAWCNRRTRLAWSLAGLTLVGVALGAASAVTAAEQPNIVVILSDDMGWSDLGCYGGEIRTTNLDALAASGVRFTQFYNTARCCPTRAALLTGLYSHQAGVGHMIADRGHDGYRGNLSPRCVTIAEVLRGAGYGTYMAGKWHVALNDRSPDGPKDTWPLARGFDRFYGTITGGGSYFDPAGLCRDNTWITPHSDPEYHPRSFYYTDAITDNALRYLQDHDASRPNDPFFLYVAFTAAHWPMHARQEDIDRYRGKYDEGYAAIRAARLERQKRLGLIDPDWDVPDLSNEWNQVADRPWEARCMEVYAAIVERMDYGIGRIVEQLRRAGKLDNTLILYMQDNGACAEGMGRTAGKPNQAAKADDTAAIKPLAPDAFLPIGSPPAQTRDGRPVRLGRGVMPGPDDSYIAYGKGWATVSNTPFREYKHWSHEGGISSPLVVHWPRGIPGTRDGQLEPQPAHLIDILATCLDVAGAKYPEQRAGQPVPPPEGVSLRPAFLGAAINRMKPLYWEHEGNRAIRDGRWKLVSKHPGDWELYDIERDRTEQHDLAADQPERVRGMAELWDGWARRVGVQPWPIAKPKAVAQAKSKAVAKTKPADTKPTAKPSPAGKQEPPALERPISGKLLTRWAKDVVADQVLPEYPRPQMVRKRWQNLNGLWQYAIRPRDAKGHANYEGEILVPFPVESTLSRVARFVGPDQQLVYRRKFRVPNDWQDQRTLLHFGAVDWQADVFVNGQAVGTHRGGYDPFTIDISQALKAGDQPNDQPEHELVVVVWDPTDAGTQPRGKQVAKPHGIWYTPVTGIWQTVWLEPVPAESISSLRIDPRVDDRLVVVQVEPPASEKLSLHLSANQGRWTASGSAARPLELKTPGAELWSPQSPKLYDLTVELRDGDRVLDRVESYFGQRKIALGSDLNGITRIMLNDQPLFQFGPLDQGWWPDGLYTAPTDAALRYDLEMTRQCGFNLVRKHVKVEPARWYYHCDRLGLLVWQDMPSGDSNARWPLDGTENTRTPEAAAQYGAELSAMIAARRNSPSIVAWVPFNEAWGQFETARWTEFVKQLDPSRLVISASGGNDFGVGDVRDIHFYPQPEAPPAEIHRAAVLGEYGGLGLPVKGHTWQDEKNWGYRQFESREQLQTTYLKYIADLRPMIESRLSAAIYTQTTDVEIEVNGVMTYDRALSKLDPRTIAAAHRPLYAPLRKLSPAEQAMAYAIAYWRFEEGPPGQLLAHDRNQADGVATRDLSGHRNHLYAHGERNAPRSGGDIPGARIPSLKLDNRLALDDSQPGAGATRDLYTDPGRSKTHMDAINSYPFTQWTLEVSFKMAARGRDQTLVGEDGRPTAAEEAPLQLLVRADDRLAIVAIDRSGTTRTVASRNPIPVGQWRHAAAVCDGQSLKLYLHDEKSYQLEGETEFKDGLVLHDGTWTVGRGFHAGGLARDAQAMLDEVRVSTRALPVEWLLWHQADIP